MTENGALRFWHWTGIFGGGHLSYRLGDDGFEMLAPPFTNPAALCEGQHPDCAQERTDADGTRFIEWHNDDGVWAYAGWWDEPYRSLHAGWHRSRDACVTT